MTEGRFPDKMASHLNMALKLAEQFKQLISDKNHILITSKTTASGDAIGSAAALALLLKRLGKRADVVIEDCAIPHQFRFVGSTHDFKNSLGHLQKFVIHVDIAETGIKELSYDSKDKELRIFITPEHGALSRDAIRTAQSDFTYDLIIAVNTPDLNSLGKLYQNNTEFFFKTPIVNIDHEPSNEHFGQVNIVDVTKSTTAEVLYSVMKEVYATDLVPEIAEAILTGMIAGTNSFRDGHIKPDTLAAASDLVHLGADRGAIIKHLYQTKSIATFRLWGSALSHLQFDEASGLVWSTITREDFARSGAKEQELGAIVDELITTAPAAKLILLVHEHPDAAKPTIHGLLRAREPHSAEELLALYGGKGNKAHAQFTVSDGRQLRELTDAIVAHIQKQVKN